MDWARKFAVLLVAVGPPAVAHTYFHIAAAQTPCFNTGTTGYRVSSATLAPDYRVRVDGHIHRAHVRVHMVDTPDKADFVLVDDVNGAPGSACGPSVKTIGLATGPLPADMIVGVASDAASADYKLYVRSTRFSQDDAAALFAVLTMTTPKYRVVGQR
jgi:hypothetical protein